MVAQKKEKKYTPTNLQNWPFPSTQSGCFIQQQQQIRPEWRK